MGGEASVTDRGYCGYVDDHGAARVDMMAGQAVISCLCTQRAFAWLGITLL